MFNGHGNGVAFACRPYSAPSTIGGAQQGHSKGGGGDEQQVVATGTADEQHDHQLCPTSDEVDPVLYDELTEWRLDPTTISGGDPTSSSSSSSSSSGLLHRLWSEDFRPCLDFGSGELAAIVTQLVQLNSSVDIEESLIPSTT